MTNPNKGHASKYGAPRCPKTAASSSRTPRDVQYDPQAGDTKRWQGAREGVQEYVVRKRGGAYLTLEVHYFATSAVDIVRRHVEYWACEGAHCDWMYSAGVVDAPTEAAAADAVAARRAEAEEWAASCRAAADWEVVASARRTLEAAGWGVTPP